MDKYSLTDEETISRISDIVPRAMSAYFICLYKADSHGICSFTRDEIVNERVRSWTIFKNDIRALSQLFLLSFFDEDKKILIEIIQQEYPCE